MFDEKSYSLKMDKTIEVFVKELSSLRTGRANASMLDLIKVDVYGQQMPINQIGSITTPEPRMINIQVWDVNNVSLVDAAIKKSDLGLNPQIDGQLIRLPVPELNEERNLASQIKRELDKTVKSFVRRANDRYGKALQLYLVNIREISQKLSKKHAIGVPRRGNKVKLVEYETEPNSINSIITGLIYEQSPSISFAEIQKNVKKISSREKRKIINDLALIRKNRRHRPPRAFEMVNYTFDLVTNYGMFRDFHRHRALTLERQLLTTDNGFDIPNEVIELGIKKEFNNCMNFTKDVFNLIKKKNPVQGQYVVNFAYNYPYFMNMNLREATHLIELRTVPQGHIDYRRVAQKMFNSIKKKHPILSNIMKYVDLNEYELERFESEKRTEEKRNNN